MSVAVQLGRLDFKRSCAHKHAHPSYGKALAHIRSVAERFGEDEAERLQPYRCRFCTSWHVGHRTNGGDCNATR